MNLGPDRVIDRALIDRTQPAYPAYRVPRGVYASLAAAILTGGRRSYRAHALRMMRGMCPPLEVEGSHYIPQSGPGMIVTNHYYRPGFWAPWFSASISAVVPVHIYWTMASAFTFPGERWGVMKRFLSHQLLTRVARVYGFNTMPPMPPASNEVAERAAGVQRLLRYLRSNPQALAGMAPEGGDQPGGALNWPPAGFGKLALALSRNSLPFFPVGAYEECGRFWLCFGQPFSLAAEDFRDRQAADRLASEQVMLAISACLPARLRGVFG